MSNQNKELTLDALEIISNMTLTKEQKEYLALSWLNLTKEQATVVWENDRIKYIRLNKPIEHVDIEIVLDKATVTNEQ